VGRERVHGERLTLFEPERSPQNGRPSPDSLREGVSVGLTAHFLSAYMSIYSYMQDEGDEK
jgi:hypothetical protein